MGKLPVTFSMGMAIIDKTDYGSKILGFWVDEKLSVSIHLKKSKKNTLN